MLAFLYPCTIGSQTLYRHYERAEDCRAVSVRLPPELVSVWCG